MQPRLRIKGHLTPPPTMWPRPKIKVNHLPPADKIPQTFALLEKFEYFPSITNMVATCKVGAPLANFGTWMTKVACIEYNAAQPSAIAMRFGGIMSRYYTSSKDTSAILVLTACKTYHSAIWEGQRMRLLIESMKTPILVYDPAYLRGEWPRVVVTTLEGFTTFEEFKIVNVVAAGMASSEALDLINIIQAYSAIGVANWEPEKFPGAKVMIQHSPEECPLSVEKVTTHLFDTGKNVIMGARCVEDVFYAQRYMRKFVMGYTDRNLPMDTLKRNNYRKTKLLYGREKESVQLLPAEEAAALETEQEVMNDLWNNMFEDERPIVNDADMNYYFS